MKRLFLYLLMAMLSASAMAQEAQFIMANADVNVMYQDFDNRYNIVVPGVSNDKITVNATNAVVEKRDQSWVIKPNRSASTVEVSVSATMNGKDRSFGTQVFKVLSLPHPAVYVTCGNKTYSSGESIMITHLLDESAVLSVGYGPGVPLQIPFEIASFVAKINGLAFTAKGKKFTREQRDRIKKMELGSMLAITDIRAQTLNGHMIALTPIALTIE